MNKHKCWFGLRYNEAWYIRRGGYAKTKILIHTASLIKISLSGMILFFSGSVLKLFDHVPSFIIPEFKPTHELDHHLKGH